ncbi:MAG TPA: membrane dipeptidase [Vicinamibacterales bacterium]|nr:membrane dipeptidase [Vicinamibacterales bacterium]
MLIVDAHLDLAMNAIEWNRDLTRPIEEIRAREGGLTDKPDRGKGTVSFAEMRRGGVGLCVATQIARYVAPGSDLQGWNSPEQAWAMTQAQLAWYRAMEERGELVQIRDRAGLDRHVAQWNSQSPTASRQPPTPIGYILSLEGADSILTPKHLERAYAQGLRAVGPAHYGPGRYAYGTNSNGDLGTHGRELLKEMERLGIILDVTHLCDESLRDALDHYDGPLWASHSNSRALVNHNRQFSDDQIRELIDRGAVIGAVMDAWMLVPGWVRGQTTPQSANVTLDTLVNHIDRVCQLAGSSRHSMIGSDLDGAFGREQCPSDVHTIADLKKLEDVLSARGYSAQDVENIFSANFLRFLRSKWLS